jgi:hypothetical protein
VLAAGLLLLCATVLLAAGAVYGDVVALGGLRRAVLEAPPASRVVIIGSTATPADVDTIDETVTNQAREVLGSGSGETALVVGSGAYVRAGFEEDDPGGLTRLGAYRAIEDHATLVEGAWPVAGATPIQAALSEGAAVALGAGPGDRLSMTSRDDANQKVEVEIVGTWRPDRTDPYWIADTLELDGVETRGPFTTSGPVVVAQADLVERVVARELELEWRAIPAVEGLRVDSLSALRNDLETLDERLRDARLPGRSLRVSSELPAILATVDRATLVSRSGVLLLTVQFAILAGYAILLVAGMLIERRRIEGALLRSRGASTLHLTAMAFGEAVLLAIPAAIIAPWAAVGVVQLLGAIGPLAESGIAGTAAVDGGVMVTAGLAAAACVIALTLPSLTSGGNPAGVRARLSRQVGRTLAQRLGIDLVLVVLAVIGLWQLRLYGSPLTQNARGALGLDPLLVAAPGIGLLAGGIVATRVVPRIAEFAERILTRRRGLVAAIGARQLARRPLRYTRSALLLMLAAALGTFAVSDAATWEASQGQQAAYRAAADMRLTLGDYSDLSSWAVGPAIRAVDGVEQAAPVSRGPVDVGRAVRSGQLLAIDPAAADLVRYPTPDEAATIPSLLAGLDAERGETRAIAIAGSPRRLAVVLDVAIAADPTIPEQPAITPDWEGIELAMTVEDGDGRLHRIVGGRGRFAGDGQRIELPVTASVGGADVTIASPVRLRSIELTFRGPADTVGIGSAQLVRVEASPDAGGDTWAAVAFDPESPDYAWSMSFGGFEQPIKVSGGRLIFPSQNEPSGEGQPIFGSGGATTYLIEATDPLPAVIPAVVGDRFLELAGLEVGSDVAAAMSGQRVTLRVIGSISQFPSLDPTQPFAIVDSTTLERARIIATRQVLPTKEWWLSIDEAKAADIEKALSADPVAAATVLGRDALTRSLAGDPISLGIIGALALGALAALAFASIGFIVSATVTTSERITEFAILRALGLSARELAAWVSLENAFLLVFGLIAGSALGLVLAWLVLPFATLTESGAAAVPAPDIVVPWLSIAPLYLAALVLFVVTVVVVSRQIRRAGISTVLRSGEE